MNLGLRSYISYFTNNHQPIPESKFILDPKSYILDPAQLPKEVC